MSERAPAPELSEEEAARVATFGLDRPGIKEQISKVRNDQRHRLYSAGDLVTVVRDDESATRRLRLDDEGDLIVPGIGALTNMYGPVIDDEGWNLYRVIRVES